MLTTKFTPKFSFRRTISQWSNVKYYIPLCSRPTVPVTSEMLSRIEPFDSDIPAVKECKATLLLVLSKHAGCDITQSSPHMYNGMLVRAALYSGAMWYFIPEFDILMLSFPMFIVFYWWFSLMTIDESCLHRRFVNMAKRV